MVNRRASGAILGLLWVVSLAVLAYIVLTWNHNPLSHRNGFPGMPFYGAVTWWFFFTIPLIGWTWGFFNDLKDDGVRRPDA